MNNARRNKLQDLADRLDVIKCALEELRDEEQEYMDNMPESMQSGVKYEAAEQAVGEIEYAVEAIEETVEHIGAAHGE